MDVRQQPRPQDSAAASPMAAVRESSNKMRNTSGGKLLFSLLTVLVVLGIVGLIVKGANELTSDRAVASKQYQALFLTNGQVYFGHLSQVESGYVKLRDIYYLQVQQAVQPKDSSASSAANQQISLAKLGSELHGPEDVMYVSRAQVLFWENLKTDGKVAKAVADYQASQKK